MANLIYTYANCRLPKYARKAIRVPDEVNQEGL